MQVFVQFWVEVDERALHRHFPVPEPREGQENAGPEHHRREQVKDYVVEHVLASPARELGVIRYAGRERVPQ